MTGNLLNMTGRFNLSAHALCLKVLVIKSRQLALSMPEESANSYKNQHFRSRWGCLFVWLKIGWPGALQTWDEEENKQEKKQRALTDKSWPIGVNKDNDQKQTWWVSLIDKERSWHVGMFIPAGLSDWGLPHYKTNTRNKPAQSQRLLSVRMFILAGLADKGLSKLGC